MAVDAEELLLQPFRELVERGNEAIQNAKEAGDDEPEISKQMLKSATNVVKEGERALQKLEPLWASQVGKYGDAFRAAIGDNDAISNGRVVLEDLLYDFDDFTEAHTFDGERFTQIQAASKSFARTAIETIKRLRIEEPLTVTAPSTPLSAVAQYVFPPLPPLPPLPSLPTASRPPTSYENHVVDDDAANTIMPGQSHVMLKRGPSSARSAYSEVLSRNGTRNSQSSSARSEYRSSGRLSNQNGISEMERAESLMRMRRPSTPDILGAESDKVRRVSGAKSPPVASEPQPPAPPNWTIPRTSAWINEQASSARSKALRGTIPEDTVTSHTSRYTVDSSRSALSVFDFHTSPSTTSNRASVYTEASSQYHNRHPSHYSDKDPHAISSFRPHPEALPVQEERPATPQQEAPLPVQHERPLSPAPVDQDFDTGLMLAEEASFHRVQAGASAQQPVWYSRESNCSIGMESTLHQMGGFCRGARLLKDEGMEAGTKSTFDYMTKLYEAQCVDCEYRQNLAQLRTDMMKDSTSSIRILGVRTRLRFLFKSHIYTNQSTMTQYGCLFCAQVGRTTREGDATVFASQEKLIRHLACHPQPLPLVDGVKVAYVKSDGLDDADLFFPDPPVAGGIPDAESARLARLPVAKASKDYMKYGEHDIVGPDIKDKLPLPFYNGAWIIGVEFLETREGKWCVGWHDGVHGYFPTKVVVIEAPSKREVRLPGMNNDGVTIKARWKWAPKSSAAGWLSFDKNDTITNVSWTHQEQWCWSGTTKNGKVGFFPQSHIKPESIREATSTTSSTASIRSGGKTKSLFGLRRAPSSH